MKHIDLLVKAAEIILEKGFVIDMSKYRSHLEDTLSLRESLLSPHNECGTTGCFLGWLPYTGIPEFVVPQELDGWGEYSKYLFPSGSCSIQQWDFLFGGFWPDSAEFNLARAMLLRDHLDDTEIWGRIFICGCYIKVKTTLDECKRLYPDIDLSGVTIV